MTDVNNGLAWIPLVIFTLASITQLLMPYLRRLAPDYFRDARWDDGVEDKAEAITDILQVLGATTASPALVKQHLVGKDGRLNPAGLAQLIHRPDGVDLVCEECQHEPPPPPTPPPNEDDRIIDVINAPDQSWWEEPAQPWTVDLGD